MISKDLPYKNKGMNSVKLKQGAAYKLKATCPSGTKITWKSSNKSVATVSGGTIKAVGAGKAVITASFNCFGKTYKRSCAVVVYKVPSKVVMAAKTSILVQRKCKNPSSFTINNIYYNSLGDVYIWYSATNSFGGELDGWASAEFIPTIKETDKYYYDYFIYCSGGYLAVKVDTYAPSSWKGTVDIKAVYAEMAKNPTIRYITYKYY